MQVRVLGEGMEAKVVLFWMLEQYMGTSEGIPHTVVDLRNTPCQPKGLVVKGLGGRLWAERVTAPPP